MATFNEFSDSMLVVSDISKYFRWAVGYDFDLVEGEAVQALIYFGQYYIFVYPQPDGTTIYRVHIGNVETDFANPLEAERHLWDHFVEAEYGDN